MIASKSALILCSISGIWFFCFSMIGLGLGVFGSDKEKWAGLLFFGFLFGLFCYLLWYLNRATCIVWIDNGVVKRKGLFCGFYKECPVNAIRKVKIKYSSHEVGFGTFVYLVDNSTQEFKKFLRIRKDSYICFRKTKKNLDFLRTFWTGTIEK